MHRRRLLALGGACVASLAGCQFGDPATSTPGGADNSTKTPTATPTESVVVDAIEVRKSIEYTPLGFGSSGVLTDPAEQYVSVFYRADPGAVGDDEYTSDGFVLEADEGSWTSGLPRSLVRYGDGRAGGADGDPRESGVARFALPSPVTVTNARIRFPPAGLEWPLPAEQRRALAAPEPRFALVELRVPASPPAGEPLPVSLTVRNTSGTDGRFLAAVHWPTGMTDDDEVTVVERGVAAGSTVTVSLELPQWLARPSSGDGVPLRVTGHVTAERTVEMAERSTSS